MFGTEGLNASYVSGRVAAGLSRFRNEYNLALLLTDGVFPQNGTKSDRNKCKKIVDRLRKEFAYRA